MTPVPGSLVDLEVERPVAGGRMIARHEGHVVFVDGAVPGELVQARVTHRSGGAWFADVVEVRRASEDREPGVFDRACGGLHYRHIRYDRQIALKGEVVADAFRRIAKLSVPFPVVVRPSPTAGYRLRARLHVQGGAVGFFREGSRDLCDAAGTGQMHPDALAVLDSVRARLPGAALGTLTWIAVTENVAGTERVIHLQPRDDARQSDLEIADGEMPGLTGITTASRGRLTTIHGRPTVTDRAPDLTGGAGAGLDAGLVLSRHALSFFQSNRFLVGGLLGAVLERAQGDRIVDLYAGVGLFAVALAARGASVVAVEGDRSSGADLSANAEPWRDRMLVVRGPVEEAVVRKPGTTPDVVILDPPRTGATKQAIAGLTAWRAPRILYVSCDPPTLARDAVRLFAAGYALTAIEAFDFFPHTAHVETLAVFDRA